MTMLDLDRIDLGELCMALEDHSGTEWFLDPDSGEAFPGPESSLSRAGWEQETGLDLERLVWIPPSDSAAAYADMEEFIACVRDPRARDLLERAIAGRGAFRRFKDTLLDFPDLRETWFKFRDARAERRAIEWLRAEGLISDADADDGIADRPDPELPELSSPLDPHAIAAAVAGELRGVYGDRLRGVILFGSWARGDAHPESDIDLLVVLDEVDDPWSERAKMRDILWRHSFENDTVVTAFPVTERALQEPTEPALIRAKAEGVAISL
jgi:predicted nucleotidyltransferase